MTLHQRLLDATLFVAPSGYLLGQSPQHWIRPDDIEIVYRPDEVTPAKQLAALRAVVELHRPCSAGEVGECLGCRIDGVAFTWWAKCPTIRAVAEALDVPLEQP